MIDDRTEILINRKLDGELSEAESSELDMLLSQDAQARALLAEYEQLDSQAHDTIQSALARQHTPPLAGLLTSDQQRPARRLKRIPGWVRTAAAAGLGLAIGLGSASMIDRDVPDTPATANKNSTPTGQVTVSDAQKPSAIPLRTTDHQLINDVVGVYDEQTQRFYLLESRQLQSTDQPVAVHY